MLLKLKRVRWQALVFLILLFSIILGAIIGSTAANIVPSSYASESSHARTIAQLTPPECSGMGLTNLIVASGGTTNGSTGNDLILGTSGNDTIRGRQGNDCIVGGGGNDILRGNRGDDILLGGNGNDRLNGGLNTDICYGNAGNDTFRKCESTP